MSTWTCVACNEWCERTDLTDSELDMLQGCYCPCADTHCEWKKDPEEDDEFECSICGKTTIGFGNNPWPFNGERCCDRCNGAVIRARFRSAKLERQLTDDELKEILEEIAIEEVRE